MRLEVKTALEDARRAAERVATFTNGKTLDEYLSDALLRAAVERQFEIIGEALTRVRKSDSSVLERITAHPRIVAFRNILIHAYDRVEDRVVWDIVGQHLPLLQGELNTLLAE